MNVWIPGHQDQFHTLPRKRVFAMKLKNLHPVDVFTYFEALTQIPRESGKEKAVSDYLMQFAKENGLEAIQEPCLNVIIKKPASPGYEHLPAVILQGHLDMVCVKEDSLDFDFDTQPIPISVDGDWIKTAGTTLGADNGIAVAMTMALLADPTAVHPALEGLFTVAEETGMDGALYLDPKNLSGKTLINLDSDLEGHAVVSCAGGVRHLLTLPLEFEGAPSHFEAYHVVISGLKGGHSGVEIGEGRANSNKLMGRFLYALEKIGARAASINGGEKDNAISKRAEMTLLAADGEGLQKLAASFEQTLKNEFSETDPDISVTVEAAEKPEEVLTFECAQKATDILLLVPYGPKTMSAAIPGLVESSNNPGVVIQNTHTLEIHNAVRSSVGSLKETINHEIEAIGRLTGATSRLISDYPEWQYAPKSKIRNLMQKIHLRETRSKLKVEAIHAGLECGFLSEKLGAIDMISIGPDMQDIHTPKERLSISSTARVYAFVKQVLSEMD